MLRRLHARTARRNSARVVELVEHLVRVSRDVALVPRLLPLPPERSSPTRESPTVSHTVSILTGFLRALATHYAPVSCVYDPAGEHRTCSRSRSVNRKVQQTENGGEPTRKSQAPRIVSIEQRGYPLGQEHDRPRRTPSIKWPRCHRLRLLC